MAARTIDAKYESYNKYIDKYQENGYAVVRLDKDEFALAYNQEQALAKAEGDPKRSLIRGIAKDSRIGDAKAYAELQRQEAEQAKAKGDLKLAKQITSMSKKAFRMQYKNYDTVEIWNKLFELNESDYDITRVQYASFVSD